MAPIKAHEDLYVRRPDNIKPADKHKYPAIGGVFHDNVPAGKEAISMHGYTDDATPPEGAYSAVPTVPILNEETARIIAKAEAEVSDADRRDNNSSGTEEQVSDQPVLHERPGKAAAHRK